MIRRDQRLLGTNPQVGASQEPPALFWTTDAHLVQVLSPLGLIPILAPGAKSKKGGTEVIVISAWTETFLIHVEENFNKSHCVISWKSSNQI